MGTQHVVIPRVAFSLAEFAVAAGLSMSTVTRRVASGEIRTLKLGGKRLVPAQKFERISRGQERAP